MKLFLCAPRGIILSAVLAVAAPTFAADGDVLVFGGTGQLGSHVVKALVLAGEDVTVFARATSNRERLKGLSVAYIIGDALKESEVEVAFKTSAFRAVVNALAGGADEGDFYNIAQEHMDRWAKKTGVEQMILHSSIGVGESMAIYPKFMLPRTGEALRQKEIAEGHLRASGLNYTIIRNGILVPHETPATGNAILTENQMLLLPVTRADLALFTVHCLNNPECAGKTYHAIDESLPMRGGR